jgi:hypothetical protein
MAKKLLPCRSSGQIQLGDMGDGLINFRVYRVFRGFKVFFEYQTTIFWPVK